jgi:hypothetical protein
MKTIMLKGREIPLIYTTYEMKTIQEEIAPLSKAILLVLGRNPDDKKDMTRFGGAEHLGAAATLIRILGNAGLEEAGEVPDLTDKKVLRALKPSEVADAVNACVEAMNEGMASEIPPKEEEGPVDVTLEEMNKKKEKED